MGMLCAAADNWRCGTPMLISTRQLWSNRGALVLRGWRLSNKTWNPITSPWMKQLTCLRIVHSGDWCLHLALHTPSGACKKWWQR